MRNNLGRMRRPMRNSANGQMISFVSPGGTKVFGSSRAATFLSDVASGNDSVDIVLLGDSNTGSAIYDFWGYHNGFCETFNNRGWTYYGTPVMSGMNGRNIDNSPSIWRGSINYYAPTGALQSGNTSGNATSYNVWSPTGNWTRYGSSSTTPDSRDDWAYLASGSAQWFTAYGISITSNNPLAAAGQSVYYRIRYGTFTSAGSGGFCPMVFNTAGAEQYGTRQFQSSAGAAYSFSAWELPWTTSGTNSYRASWAFVGTGSNVCKGPVAIHSQSFYRRTKGWSLHSHAYLGGFSSDMIASVIVNNVGSTLLQTHLKELRERQILATGSGRVLVVFQFGVNQSTGPTVAETPAKWVQAARDIWTKYKTEWAALGYPDSDLACLCWVSHASNLQDNSSSGSNGNLIAVRAAAIQMALDYPDMTVVDVNQLMSYTDLLMGQNPIGGTGVSALSTYGLPYFQRLSNWPNAGSDFPQHLSGGQISAGVNHPTDGYVLLCGKIVDALFSR